MWLNVDIHINSVKLYVIMENNMGNKDIIEIIIITLAAIVLMCALGYGVYCIKEKRNIRAAECMSECSFEFEQCLIICRLRQ